MAENEIKQRISIDADQAARMLERIADLEAKLAKALEGTGDAARTSTQRTEQYVQSLKSVSNESGYGADKTKQLGGVVDALGQQFIAVATSIIGVGGVVEALRVSRQEMEENARAARALKEAQLDLQFLNQGYNAADLAIVKQTSEKIGRPQEIVTEGYARFKSQTSSMTEDQRSALWREVAEFSLTSSAALPDLVDFFAKGASQVSDPGRLQNMLRQTSIESPESSPSALARMLPQVWAIGAEMGLAHEQSSGLLAFAAGKAGTPEMGTTGLRNSVVALQGKLSAESAEVLTQAGVTQDMDFFTKLETLRGAMNSGKLDGAGLQTIAGKESIAVFGSLVRELPAARATVDRVVAATNAPLDLTRQAINDIFSKDAQQAMNIKARQAEVELQNLKASDVDSQRAMLARTLFETEMEKSGLTPFMQWSKLKGYDYGIGVTGRTPEEAIRFATSYGYSYGEAAIKRLNEPLNTDMSQIGQSPASGGVLPAATTGPKIYDQYLDQAGLGVSGLNDQTSFNDAAGLHPHLVQSLNEFTRGALNTHAIEMMKGSSNVTINITVTPINQLFQAPDPGTVIRRPWERE